MRFILAIATRALPFMILGTSSAEEPNTQPTPATRPAAKMVEWEAKDIKGREVKIPSEKITVLMFIMEEQTTSQKAIQHVRALLKDFEETQVILIVSGREKLTNLENVCDGECLGPVVLDPHYSVSGKMDVHAWPTTLVIQKTGEEIAHLAGVPASYARNLEAYLDFAFDRITRSALDERLNGNSPASDGTSRFILAAQRLIEKGMFDKALEQLQKGVELYPKSAGLHIALARLLLNLEKTGEVMKLLDEKEAILPPSQFKFLRAKAFAQLGKWEDAVALFKTALAFNMAPAEGWYELGKAYEQMNELPHAVQAFRKAFEATDQGKRIVAETSSVKK